MRSLPWRVRSPRSTSPRRRTSNRLLAALNSTTDAVIGVDGAEQVCFANLAAGGMLLRPNEEIVGRPFAWLFPNEEMLQAVRASALGGERLITMTERPGKRFYQVSTTRIDGGGDWRALVVLQDVTDVRRSEQMRRDFVANVSHELRTPLASIRAVLETLEAGALNEPAAARDFVGRAQTEVDRLTQMVSELMELSRIESGDLPMAREPVDLGVVIADAVDRLRPQADRRGLHLRSDIPAPLSAVLGDAERIERALVNLIHNALKFTAAGGEVCVVAREREGNVSIEIADTGAGIDERDLARVFERFYKADSARHSDGSGLGLALVKHTVEAHGGSVAVESERGRGSKFTVTFPTRDQAARQAETRCRATGGRHDARKLR